jgi:predicted transcriptional regulator
MTLVSASLPPDLLARLQRAAQSRRRSMSSVIRILIEDHIAADEPAANEARPWP